MHASRQLLGVFWSIVFGSLSAWRARHVSAGSASASASPGSRVSVFSCLASAATLSIFLLNGVPTRLVLKVTLNTPAMRQSLYEPAEPAPATLVNGQLSWLLDVGEPIVNSFRTSPLACSSAPVTCDHAHACISAVGSASHSAGTGLPLAVPLPDRAWSAATKLLVTVMVPALLLGFVVMQWKPLSALETRVLAMRVHWSISPAMCADSVAASVARVAMAFASCAARAFRLSRLASACVARWFCATASCFVRADILASAGCAPFATSGPARCAAMALISVNARSVSTCAWRAPPLSAPDTTQSRRASASVTPALLSIAASPVAAASKTSASSHAPRVMSILAKAPLAEKRRQPRKSKKKKAQAVPPMPCAAAASASQAPTQPNPRTESQSSPSPRAHSVAKARSLAAT
ncbi:hypothetical protein, conserved in T. vivax [Trypanosoma vivax Y486]|uniref:Uncharacterized protein n=1 Tax=Trypanosoma vivax (strain Y486) TaxID=1055687 RepID=F9WSH8_TRYVY|nr:hypothetical protein, conserved in T. vivax [Trypanosoma vivax Y486]|eukprot:CCD20517.1 hypothetical protein, conserved in T. vivax [Trypanosoma vivax Y486]